MPTPGQFKEYLDVILGGLCAGPAQAVIFLVLAGGTGYLLARYWFAPRHESVVATIGDQQSALAATKQFLDEVRSQHDGDRARLKEAEAALRDKEQQLKGRLADGERKLVEADVRLLRSRYIGSRLAGHASLTASVNVWYALILQAAIVNLLNKEQVASWGDLSDAANLYGDMVDKLRAEHDLLALAADWDTPGPPMRQLLDSHAQANDVWAKTTQMREKYLSKMEAIVGRRGDDFPGKLDAIKADREWSA